MNHEAEDESTLTSNKRIVYIIGTYPDLTKTFIDREVLEAKRAGVNLSVVAMRRSNTDGLSLPVQRLMGEILYLVPFSLISLTRAHARFLVCRFPVYIRTLAYLLSREHPTLMARCKTFLHFCAGVLAADYLRRIKMPDHIHAHFADGAAVVAMTVSRLLDKPYSVTAHAYDIYRSPVFLNDKIAQAKFVTTCTAYNKEHLERTTGRPIELIYHGLDFEALRETGAPRDKASPPLILSVGRLQEKKGFSYLIEACARLKEIGQDFACEIVGEGPGEARLATQIEQLNVQDRVRLLGALPNAEVMAKYSVATTFVLPSCVTEDGDRDGIPNVILEAMAIGLPVVSTNVSGIPEVVQEGRTGLLVESRDAVALCDAVSRVLRDHSLAAELGRNASQFVASEFDIRQNVKYLARLLSE